MQAFASFFGNNLFLATIILAMIPALEGRAALPFALSFGLHPALAFFCTFLGSILPAYPVIILTKKIKGRFFDDFFKERYSSKLAKLSKEQNTLKKMLLLAGFVAIPLPMTGVWSGSVIGGLSNLKTWQGFVAVVVGSLIACGIILAVCLLFAGSELVIFYISLILLALFFCYELLAYLIKRLRKKRV